MRGPSASGRLRPLPSGARSQPERVGASRRRAAPHDPTPWYERSPTAVAAGALGIFLLASIAFAVVTVSDNSTRSPSIVTPLPSVTTSSNPTAAAPPPPGDSPQPTPPTVTETMSTENATTQAPVPGLPGGRRWRLLFPRLFGGR